MTDHDAPMPKFCVDCAHFASDMKFCWKDVRYSLVTGAKSGAVPAIYERNDPGSDCGPDGKRWAPKGNVE